MLVVARALIMDLSMLSGWTPWSWGRSGLLATARIYSDVEPPADSDTSFE